MIDRSHDAAASSWVEGADAHRDFPIQNLPLGIFHTGDGDDRCGTAIGDHILDLRACAREGLLPDQFGPLLDGTRLNPLLAQGNAAIRRLRLCLFDLLSTGSPRRDAVTPFLHAAKTCTMSLPARIGDYSDFYAGIVHAENLGRLLRPDHPLMPNYKYVPIAYHGRASSIIVSGTPVRRPSGQIKPAGDDAPHFGPCQRLDYEVELGLWIGRGNDWGTAIPIGTAGDHIAGISLLNDWSARDIQIWEYQPLGPFLAKSFGSTLSPWIITAAALEPFRAAAYARLQGDPRPLPYLWDEDDQACGALAVEIEVGIRSSSMIARGDPPFRTVRTDARHLYWTPAQMVTHHASNGCNLRPGDLLGTGTISAPGRDGFGSLMEVTSGGREAFDIAPGETRLFLEDGDEIVLTGRCSRTGFRSIGFGECRAQIIPGDN